MTASLPQARTTGQALPEAALGRRGRLCDPAPCPPPRRQPVASAFAGPATAAPAKDSARRVRGEQRALQGWTCRQPGCRPPREPCGPGRPTKPAPRKLSRWQALWSAPARPSASWRRPEKSPAGRAPDGACWGRGAQARGRMCGRLATGACPRASLRLGGRAGPPAAAAAPSLSFLSLPVGAAAGGAGVCLVLRSPRHARPRWLQSRRAHHRPDPPGRRFRRPRPLPWPGYAGMASDSQFGGCATRWSPAAQAGAAPCPEGQSPGPQRMQLLQASGAPWQTLLVPAKRGTEGSKRPSRRTEWRRWRPWRRRVAFARRAQLASRSAAGCASPCRERRAE